MVASLGDGEEFAVSSLRSHVAQSANVGLTLRNWLVGGYLIEFEQNGEERAEYGESLIPKIAAKPAIKGLSTTILKHCRNFYLGFPEIRQSLTGEFLKLLEKRDFRIGQSPTGESISISSSGDWSIKAMMSQSFPGCSLTSPLLPPAMPS